MSHFTVIVIGEDIEGQLAPYDEELQSEPYPEECWCVKHPMKDGETCEECDGSGICQSTYNKLSKWDWYSVGGRWTGALKLKEGKAGSIGEPGVFNNSPRFDADQALKGDIDFEGMLKENVARAEKTYDECAKALANGEDKTMAYFKYGIELDNNDNMPDREVYIAQNTQPITAWAVVKDGEWYEEGRMGWWAMTSGESSEKVWDQKVRELLSDVPDDVMISVLDCHI